MQLSNNDNNTSERFFYLFIISVFLFIISPNLLSDGMFMDGLIYSTIAKNLADGSCSFWNLSFTATCYPTFHEHPPLAFGIQSLFFSVFGQSRYVDKIYSLSTFIVVAIIIIKIWKNLGYKYAWLPLLLWLIIPLVSWASTNNMLENTLSVFTSLSVLFYLNAVNKKQLIYLFLSGLMLSLGFLTKGFVAFYLWSFPFFWWLFHKQNTFRKMFLDSIFIFLFTLLPLFLLVFAYPDARQSLLSYIDIQVVNSLKNSQTVDSRFFIIKRLFSELIPVAIIFILLTVLALRKKANINLIKANIKPSFSFFLLGLSGVLPIMISMKQSGYYILTTFPFFAIGLGILLIPFINHLMNELNGQSRGFNIFKKTSIVLFLLSVFTCLTFSNHIGRDKDKLNDTYIILAELPRASIINIPAPMFEDWTLQGYYSRYKNVSLDPDINNKRDYLLIQNDLYSDTISLYYEQIMLKTKQYKLFKRK